MNDSTELGDDETPYVAGVGACEVCWSQAFVESRMGPESQVEAYKRLLIENDGKPGHE